MDHSNSASLGDITPPLLPGGELNKLFPGSPLEEAWLGNQNGVGPSNLSDLVTVSEAYAAMFLSELP